MKFLIVDTDEAAINEIKNTITENNKFDIVGTMKESIQLYSKAIKEGEYYQGIFINLELADGNAIDLLKQIRRLERIHDLKCKIFLMTENESVVLLLNFFSKDSEIFLLKPINRREFLQILENAGISLRKNNVSEAGNNNTH